MKTNIGLLLIVIVMVLFTACGVSGGIQDSEPDANVTRDMAIQAIRDISKGTGDADIKAYPDMDRVDDGIRYYYIEVLFANKMTAAYFVDENEGKIFVAFGGELDTENPLPDTQSDQLISSAESTVTAVTEINVTQTAVIKDIFDIIGKTAEQVEQKFGNIYKKVNVNYDGYMEGFYYADIGITAAFGSDETVSCVYCTEKIDINGARSGMDFSQIQEKLGEAHLSQKWAETPVNAAYEIRYSTEGRTVVFFSRQKEGDNSIMSIS